MMAILLENGKQIKGISLDRLRGGNINDAIRQTLGNNHITI